jgi:signal transduction histidine kinase
MPDNVGVRVDITRDLIVRGDASQVRQVLLNLVNNARDALGARGGSIAITGKLLRHDGGVHPDDVISLAAGNYVELEVADDGPGHAGESDAGVGLAGMRERVRLLSGEFEAHTSNGRGFVVRARIPT